jgi:branched-subunit amino acid ABC-type transport system permease component
MKTLVLWITVVVIVAVASALIGTLVLSIRREPRTKRLWANFGLSLAFCAFFLVTWVAHALAEWEVYTEQQRAHGEPTSLSGYVVEFGQSTLENWQSEFLQLFSFVVFAAVLIHKGSAESKDGEDEIRATLRQIEKRLDELAPAKG